MKSIFDSLNARNSSTKLVFLKETRLITDEMKSEKQWADLSNQYSLPKQQSTSKAIVSLINAILTQKRAVFGLTRFDLNELLTNDPNWSKTKGFANAKYREIISQLTDGEDPYLVEVQVPKRIGTNAKFYRVVNPIILGYIAEVSAEDQHKSIVDYYSSQTQDGKTDANQDSKEDLSVHIINTVIENSNSFVSPNSNLEQEVQDSESLISYSTQSTNQSVHSNPAPGRSSFRKKLPATV